MKILRIAVEGSPLFQERLDICFYAQQRVSEEQKELLYPLFSKVFLNTTNVFAGINASGKTSTLKVILFALHLLSGKSINSMSVNSLLGRTNETTFRIYFYSEKTAEIYKLETVISFKDMNSEGQPVYIISSEKLWCKKASSVTSRTRMLNFDETKPLLDRNDPNKKELLSFLADDSSIIIAKNKKDDDAPHFVDLVTISNPCVYGLGVLGILPNLLEVVPDEVISFLDPSIEYLNFEHDKQHSIHLKFKGKDELVLVNPQQLIKYLSSGTLKGILIFTLALNAFMRGGYLIVDELENSFNKEIVCVIIRLFKEYKFNINGGTLIYSTHYPELLDENDRNDNIFITNNHNGITVKNLSTILERNDMKKSDVYQSGFKTGTAPSYDSYMALRKEFKSMIEPIKEKSN